MARNSGIDAYSWPPEKSHVLYPWFFRSVSTGAHSRLYVRSATHTFSQLALWPSQVPAFGM